MADEMPGKMAGEMIEELARAGKSWQ